MIGTQVAVADGPLAGGVREESDEREHVGARSLPKVRQGPRQGGLRGCGGCFLIFPERSLDVA